MKKSDSNQHDSPPNASIPESIAYGTHTLDPKFMSIYQRGLEATGMKDNVWRRPRFFQMLEMLALTRGIDGATAEAGCFRGLASNLICQAIQKEDENVASPHEKPAMPHTHQMIDSFAGLSEPCDADGDFARKRFDEGAFAGATLKRCRQAMGQFAEDENLSIEIAHGWIPEILDEIAERKYRFVHVDVDIYQPTIDSLRYFFPRLSPGGIMVVDDFGPWPDGNWPGCAVAVKEFSGEVNLPFAKLDTGNALFIKRM